MPAGGVPGPAGPWSCLPRRRPRRCAVEAAPAAVVHCAPMPSLSEIVTTFLAVFIVVDPLGLIPVFISLSAGFDERRRRATIAKAVVTAFAVLCLFIFTGGAILRFLGIQTGSFSIAGGILLFIVSIDLLFGRPGRTKTSADEEPDRADVAIFPLGVPMLAGPGTITTILIYVSRSRSPVSGIPLLLACVVVALAVAALTMFLSSGFLRVLGRTGVSVIERIMGILLAALSVQFVHDGMVQLGALAAPGS